MSVLTLLVVLSVVPLDRQWLAAVSPLAHELRGEAETLVGASASNAPISLAPFLTLRSLWLWFACLAVFAFSLRLAERPGNVRRLTFLLVLLGVGLGALGVFQWLEGVQALLGRGPSSSLRASGTFGNANHYAACQSMLLLVGLGWYGGLASLSRRDRSESSAIGRSAVAGLGILLIALGLLFSLSRSGITFALAGSIAFLVLASGRVASRPSGQERRARGRLAPRTYAALALAITAFIVWLGAEPLLARFGDLATEMEIERALSGVVGECSSSGRFLDDRLGPELVSLCALHVPKLRWPHFLLVGAQRLPPTGHRARRSRPPGVVLDSVSNLVRGPKGPGDAPGA